ncbi:MAG: hypothetical protein AAF204_01785, partial [Pseudomonadota bacterium]
ELMIAVHGYNSGRSSVRDWYKDIFQYINRHDAAIPCQGNQAKQTQAFEKLNQHLQLEGSETPSTRAAKFVLS